MHIWRFVRDTPCAVLLGVQLLGVLLYPFMEDRVAGRTLFAAFGLVVLGLVLRAVRHTPGATWVAMLLAAPCAVLLLIVTVTANETLLPWSSAFEAALYFYGAIAMLRYMTADNIVTTDELFAIGVVFTLVAWAFAYVFVVMQALEPGSYIAAVNPQADRTWTELLYLSFTTLSSTGLSDIVPITGHTRSVLMLEQLAGVLYIAMVVTRLVNLRRASREQPPAPGTDSPRQ